MDGAATARLMIAPVAFDQAPIAVRVLRAHPVGQGPVGSVLASSLRRRVEIAVHAEEFFAAPPIRRVGVEDLVRVVLEEYAVAGEVFEAGTPSACGPFRSRGLARELPRRRTRRGSGD